MSGGEENSQQMQVRPLAVDTMLLSKLVSAGTAACIAEAITLPMDCTKIKLQVDGGSVASVMRQIAKTDGVKGFFRGLIPGLHRQLGFCTIRLGLYDSTKDFYMKKTPLNDGLPLRFAAGISTAIAAVCVAQPTEVVKIRMQAAKSGTVRYTGTLSAYYQIAVNEGSKGLWSGLGPNIIRLSICNIGEVVTYDSVKQAMLKRKLMEDAFPLHFFAAICAGFVTTTLTSPVDVVKTRYINSIPGTYGNVGHCAVLSPRRAVLPYSTKDVFPAFSASPDGISSCSLPTNNSVGLFRVTLTPTNEDLTNYTYSMNYRTVINSNYINIIQIDDVNFKIDDVYFKIVIDEFNIIQIDEFNIIQIDEFNTIQIDEFNIKIDDVNFKIDDVNFKIDEFNIIRIDGICL